MTIRQAWLSAALAILALTGVPSPSLYAADEPTVTLELRQASLDSALRMLFKNTPYSYVIAPGVTAEVTLTLNHVTFPQALRAVLDLNDLTYRKEQGDVYHIVPRPEQQEDQTPPPLPVASAPATGDQWFFIGPGGRYELQYLDCRDVAQWFGGLVATGTPMIPMPITGGLGVGSPPRGSAGGTTTSRSTSSRGRH